MKQNQEIALGHLLERYPVEKLLKIYALPAILNMLVIAMYNIADRIFIGQGAGAMAICGLALTLPCITLICTVGTLTGIGAASGITVALIKNDSEKAEIIMGNALLLNILVSVITVWLGLHFLEPVLFNFGGSSETVPYAVDYLEIMIPACIVNNINLTFSNTVRIAEKRKKFMTIMLAGPVINIILDPIFIFQFKMGIEGAAWASLISMLVSSGFILYHFKGKNRKLELHRVNFKPDIKILLYIIITGMPAFIMNITTAMVNIIINRHLIEEGGDYSIGAFGIISSLVFLVFGIYQGICQGMQPILNFNYGCCNRNRVKEILQKAIKYATIVSIAGFILFETTAEYLIHIFTSDKELIRTGAEGLRLYVILLPLTGFQVICTSFFQSINQPVKAIIMNISRQFLFLIPALFILSAEMGLTGIWLATPAADFLVIIITTAFIVNAFRCGSCSKEKFVSTTAPISGTEATSTNGC